MGVHHRIIMFFVVVVFCARFHVKSVLSYPFCVFCVQKMHADRNSSTYSSGFAGTFIYFAEKEVI